MPEGAESIITGSDSKPLSKLKIYTKTKLRSQFQPVLHREMNRAAGRSAVQNAILWPNEPQNEPQCGSFCVAFRQFTGPRIADGFRLRQPGP